MFTVSDPIHFKVIVAGVSGSGVTTYIAALAARLLGGQSYGQSSGLEKQEPTLFFDLLPIPYRDGEGQQLILDVYGLPGQSAYPTVRKMALKGVGFVLFFADSSPNRLDENRVAWDALNLELQQLGPLPPRALLFSKRDLNPCLSTADLNRVLNCESLPQFECSASLGDPILAPIEYILRSAFPDRTFTVEQPER